MPATIRDVARHAGVSASTVSRVFNGTAVVDEAKRRRVEASAAKLQYVPHPVARSLAGLGTGSLGVLLPFVSGEFFAEFLSGVDQQTRDSGFFLTISATHRRPREFVEALRALDKRVDALLVMATEAPATSFAQALPSDIPITFVNTVVEDPKYDVLNFDNYGGAYAVTAHLVEQGHRRIAHVKGPAASHDAQERLRGYRDALAHAGIAPDSKLEIGDDFSQEVGLAAVPPLLALNAPPTAIFACNDAAAIGVLRGLSLAGLTVPGDVSVAGFDDTVIARFTTPPLTSVRVPARQLGERAVQRLVMRTRGHDVPAEHVVAPVELVVRESTQRPHTP